MSHDVHVSAHTHNREEGAEFLPWWEGGQPEKKGRRWLAWHTHYSNVCRYATAQTCIAPVPVPTSS